MVGLFKHEVGIYSLVSYMLDHISQPLSEDSSKSEKDEVIEHWKYIDTSKLQFSINAKIGFSSAKM